MKKRLAILFSLAACSQGSQLTEREQRREAEKYAAATKRRELDEVAGVYQGQLTSPTGVNQFVILNLEVKDLPDATREGVDPVLVPKIVGHLRFRFGGADSKEYIDAPVIESDYAPSTRTVHLVVNHAQFDRMILQMQLSPEGRILNGTWNAETVGLKGDLNVERTP